jgi:hypothetical protein
MPAVALLTLLTLSACAPALVSSWKAPDAAAFRLRGDKVAAVVMATDETTRRAGEDAEISSDPVTYSGPIYGGFWGGYYGHGWVTRGDQVSCQVVRFVRTRS